MDSWEWNKIAGAILGTLIFVLVIGIVSDAVYEVPAPSKPGYAVQGVETAAIATNEKPAAAQAAEPLPDFAKAIPTADTADGRKIAQRCAQCHDWSKNGPNKIGPNLYGLLDRARASHPGFDYSSAMKAKGGTWTYAELFQFLKSPPAYIPGTKMTFAGLSSEPQRIDLIAFIRTWADSPEPLPQAAQPAAAPAPKPAVPGVKPPPQMAKLAAVPAKKTAAPAVKPPLQTVQPAAAPAKKPASPAGAPLPGFAAADVAHGKKIAQSCALCHDWSKGGPNKIGPNLYGLLGLARASHPGFSYSSAMKAKSGTWTYAELFQFLKSPQAYIPGTKMIFAGLSSEKDRIDLIAYIRSWADNPEPLPAPPGTEKPAGTPQN